MLKTKQVSHKAKRRDSYEGKNIVRSKVNLSQLSGASFFLCSFTLSVYLVPSACWHLSYCVILAGWENYKGVVWGMYVLF